MAYRKPEEEFETFEKDFFERNNRMLNNLSIKKNVNFDSYKDASFALGIFILIVKGEFKKEYFERYVNLGILHFQRGACEEPTFKFDLDGEAFELESEKNTSGRDTEHWDDIMSMAIILRDKEKINTLIELIPFF